MKLEIWTDFMCPLCYIGKTNLENALHGFEHKKDVEIAYRPFQLYPDAPSNTGMNYYEYTAMTHGNLPIGYVKDGNRAVVTLAKSIGITYDLDSLIPTNTGDALRVGLHAQKYGKAKEWSEKIFKGYMVEGLDVGKPEVLVNLGSDIGLDPLEILQILEGDRYRIELKKECVYAKSIGIRGTPFFVINDKYHISGVRSKEEFLIALKDMWSEANVERGIAKIEGLSCGADSHCE
jgi:predicted DsbA family dithiol-disulfide isomerase